jgi:hypothetical protein
MLKNILLTMVVTSSLLLSMSVSQVKEASQDGLGCIKGVGAKKLQRIIDYKKNNPINSIDDLINIKGIGKVILKNIKEDVVKKSCRRDKRKPISKKAKRPKKNISAE